MFEFCAGSETETDVDVNETGTKVQALEAVVKLILCVMYLFKMISTEKMEVSEALEAGPTRLLSTIVTLLLTVAGGVTRI